MKAPKPCVADRILHNGLASDVMQVVFDERRDTNEHALGRTLLLPWHGNQFRAILADRKNRTGPSAPAQKLARRETLRPAGSVGMAP